MQSSGDDVLEAREWKRDKRGVYIASRMLEYNHVVNCASRSPHGQGSKGTTLYRKFGEMTLSIETDTFVQDVPIADCVAFS